MDIATDANGDWFVTNGALQMVSGLDEVRQHIKNRLLLQKREWFLDTNAGIDYRNIVLIKNPNLGLVAAAIKAEIIAASDAQITGFTLTVDPALRKLTADYRVLIDEKTIEDSVTV